jgi:hypothetical protein
MTAAPRIIIPREHQAAPRGDVMPVGSIIDINSVETEEAKCAKVEAWIANCLGHAIQKIYPRREWRVSVDIPARIIVVMCPSLSTRKGYHIHMSNRTILELQEIAVRGAGEVLERYGMSRAKWVNPDDTEAIARRADGEARGGRDAEAEWIDGSRRIVLPGHG